MGAHLSLPCASRAFTVGTHAVLVILHQYMFVGVRFGLAVCTFAPGTVLVTARGCVCKCFEDLSGLDAQQGVLD